MSDGKRKVTSICELTKIKDDNNIELKEIFAFKQKGLTENGEVDGEYILYDYVPKVYNIIKNRGYNELDDIFKNHRNKSKENDGMK